MVPDIVLPGTIVRTEGTLEGLLARVGAGVHLQAVATVESWLEPELRIRCQYEYPDPDP